jgi:hypothetical protein
MKVWALKGTCQTCGKYGHKAMNCKEKATKKDLTCSFCHLKGHTEKYCWKKQKIEKGQKAGKEQKEIKGSSQEVLIGSEKDKLRDQNIWIGEEIDQAIILGDGKKLKATKKGKIQVLVKVTNGKDIFFTLEEVKYVGELWRKLFSLNTALKKGASVVSEGTSLVLRKGSLSSKFEEVEQSGLLGIKLTIRGD